MMKILAACEESQAVTIEGRKNGHEVYSCDLQECSGGHPEWNIKGDVIPLLNGNCRFQTMDGEWHEVVGEWDMIIAFPPCTHLAVSGARHFEKKRKDGRQREAIEFFCSFFNAKCSKIIIENPVGIISGGSYVKTYFPDLAEKYDLPRSYTQAIQPWWFAENENDSENYHEKTTCLWEKGVPQLKEPAVSFRAPKRFVTTTGKSFPEWYSKTSLRGRGERQKVRSKTFPGIARVMIATWAEENTEVKE